jgi:cell wall assembly regulator SMI1
MQIEQMAKRLELQASQGLVFRVQQGATAEIIHQTELRLGLTLPEQVKSFWSAFNGLEINDPPFKILSLTELQREGRLLPFCICNRAVSIAFDVSVHNRTGQWSIVNAETNYQITFTMASFWSTHLWAWIIKRRPIWNPHPASGC